jgi:hypothetical protein
MRTESAGKLTTSVGETGEKGRARSGCRIIKYQIPSTKPGPRPEGGDSEGETGNPPAGWESEGQISGCQEKKAKALNTACRAEALEAKAGTLKPKIAEMLSLRSFLRPPLELGTGLAFSLQNRN